MCPKRLLVPGKTALLVIDMQNDFVEKGALLEIPGIRKNIGRLSDFIKFARSLGIPVVYTRHCFDPVANPIEAKLFPEMRENGLRKGTHGWEIAPALAPMECDIVVDKTRYDAFFKTNLGSVLKKREIETLIITGTMTEVCCESTARSAMFLDYDVVFCSDLTFTSGRKMHERTLAVIGSGFGRVANSEEVMKMAGAGPRRGKQK